MSAKKWGSLYPSRLPLKLFIFKLVATGLVTAALLYPFFSPEGRAGVLTALASIGWLSALILVAAFFIGVVLYCRALHRCLSLIPSACRTARPKSVWLMLVLPYNFIEDFFIINNIVRSLRNAARAYPDLGLHKHLGAVSGFGWCGAQIVSLSPNLLGTLASLVGLVLWVIHWRSIARVNRLLSPHDSNAHV